MKGVDTIARVRREHVVRGKTMEEIVRDLHVSRNTVRRILRSGATAFEDERTVQPQPRLGPWRAELEGLLAANAARASRERLALMRIFGDLRGLGYAGGGACPPAPPAATGGTRCGGLRRGGGGGRTRRRLRPSCR
jgi:hypothetical protein